ncbi:MAG: bifunctional nuclease family protein [Armatimonadetes bacterium]|nr:bifunctional nuclease family protein [Armatimonadota bacterium]
MADERDDDQPEELDKPPSFFPYGEEELEPIEDEPIEVTVEGVYLAESQGNVQRFVMLADDSGRRFHIVIGLFEASAISYSLDGQQPDRPMTHDLLKIVIERLGGSLVRVLIDDIWTSTYYAKLYLLIDNEEVEIDSRPSDAIALALRFNVPVYVSPQIFDHAAEN